MVTVLSLLFQCLLFRLSSSVDIITPRSTHTHKGLTSGGDDNDNGNDNSRLFRFRGEMRQRMQGRFGLSKEKEVPIECCQICPQKFYLDLELGEYTADTKRAIYDNFLEWHVETHESREVLTLEDIENDNSRRRFVSVPPRKEGQEVGTFYAYLEIEDEVRDPEIVPPPPSIEMLGGGPCCSLCPELFWPKPPRTKTPGLLGGSIGMFNEVSESIRRGKTEEETEERNDALDVFLEQGQTYAGFMPHISNDGSTGGGECCKICPAQFFSPRSYGDLLTGKEKKKKKSKFKEFAKKLIGQADPTCCRTCLGYMEESSELMTDGPDPDDPHQRMSDQAAIDTKNAEMRAIPRNPSNRREYGTEKSGGLGIL